MKQIFYLWIILASLLPVSAQQLAPMSRAALDSLVYPPVMDGADRILKFQRYTAQYRYRQYHPCANALRMYRNKRTCTPCTTGRNRQYHHPFPSIGKIGACTPTSLCIYHTLIAACGLFGNNWISYQIN